VLAKAMYRQFNAIGPIFNTAALREFEFAFNTKSARAKIIVELI
jgi:hypothetical protein